MKVGLLEISSKNHYVLVQSWIAVLERVGAETVLFLNCEVDGLVNSHPACEKFIKEDDVTGHEYLQQVAKYELQALIICSLQTHLPAFYRFKPSFPCFLTIHNARTWFAGNELVSLKNIVKRFIRSQIKRRVAAYFVNSEPMLEFGRALTSKDIHVMPFTLYLREELPETSVQSEKIKITYPGMISTSRRSYDVFIELAKRFPQCDFVLLGSPSRLPEEKGREVIESIERAGLENMRYFTDFISPEDYERELQATTLLFSDLHVDFRKEDYVETYGVTKDSGISYLMINYALPCLMNSEFQNIPDLQPTSYFFDDVDHAAQQLQRIMHVNDWSTVRSQCIAASKRFTPTIFAEKFKDLFDSK